MKSLLGLALLGSFGGIFIEGGDLLLRIWARDQGMVPKQLDVLSGIELLHGIKFLWSPFFMLGISLWGWGTRRTWIFLSLMGGAVALGSLALVPFFGILFLGLLVLFHAIKSSFDMLVVASQMDATKRSYWGINENFCVNGYRFGMMASQWGVLSLSQYGCSWPFLYGLLAIIIMGGAFLMHLPFFSFLDAAKEKPPMASLRDFFAPFMQWFQSPGSGRIAALMMLYRVQDSLIDPQKSWFYLDLGFSKAQLGFVSSLGIWGSVLGGIVSGICIRFKGYASTLILGLGLHALTGCGFLALSLFPQKNPWVLSLLVCDALTKGFSMIAFFSFQLYCCKLQHALSQLALLTALNELGMKCIGMRSGFIAHEWGWPNLFGTAISLNVPVLFLIIWVMRILPQREENEPISPSNS
jgi:PAT family beta-lactamase induction signal transducer AmpG